MTRIITLTGGREGTGESRIATDLAENLAAKGQRVCLLALVGTADTAGGLPRWSDITTLADSLHSDSKLSVLQLASTCDLVIGGRDAHWLRRLDNDQLAALGERLQGFADYDYLIIDAGTGSEQNQLAFALASPELLLVITPESDALSAAYSLLKLLYAEQYSGAVGILVNHCETPESGQHTYDKLRGIAGFYLEMPLPLAGVIAPDDPAGSGRYAAHMEQLTVDLLARQADAPDLDMSVYSRRYLQAAGALPAHDSDASLTPVFAATPDDSGLHDQLEFLSARVDELIAEVERLRRTEPPDQPAQRPLSPPRPHAPAEYCDTAGIAAMASGSESVTADGETFTVYHLRRADGRQLRFACQSADDDLEEPEPQSRLS